MCLHVAQPYFHNNTSNNCICSIYDPNNSRLYEQCQGRSRDRFLLIYGWSTNAHCTIYIHKQTARKLPLLYSFLSRSSFTISSAADLYANRLKLYKINASNISIISLSLLYSLCRGYVL